MGIKGLLPLINPYLKITNFSFLSDKTVGGDGMI